MIVEELIAILGFKMQGEREASRFSKQLDQLKTKLSAAVAIGAAAAGAALAGMAKSVIDTGSTFEKLNIQLESLEGSSEKAKAAMAWIKDFAERTPLDLEGVVKGYTQMRTYGLDPTNGSFQALVDTMAMSGKGQEHLEGIIMAVGQAWTKQKLQGEEAMQLLERGVPVWDLLSKEMGKTVPELQELATKGKLGRKEIQLLINAMGRRAYGASEKFSKSLEGVNSRLADMWQSFKLDIADSGVFDAYKTQLVGLLDYVQKLRDDGTLKQWATTIGSVMMQAGNGIKNVGTAIWEILKAFGKLIGVEQSLAPLMVLIGAFALAFAPIPTAIAAVVLALEDLGAWFNGDASVIGAFIEMFKAGWADLSASVTDFGARLAATMTSAMNNALSAIQQWGANALAAYVQIWASIFAAIQNAVQGIVDWIKEAFNIDLTAAGAFIINSLLNGIKAGAQAVLDYLSGLKNSITGFFSGTSIQGPTISGPGIGNAGPPRPSPTGGGRTGPAAMPGQSSPDNPALKRSASFNAALARTNVASLAGGVRGAGGNVMTDNSRTEINVKVDKTNASPQDIANAVKTAQAESKMSNVFFTSASPATA